MKILTGYERISLFSNYSLSFCVANNKTVPPVKQINEAFTQKVSYAHRKRQRNQGKLFEV